MARNLGFLRAQKLLERLLQLGFLAPQLGFERFCSVSGDRAGADLVAQGVSALATIGSTAPFVGLLGTVVGVINAFVGIASSGSGGIGAVSAGIAEALVATAMGILVAVPVFKAVTGLPPFVGILFGLGILWAVGDRLHRQKDAPLRSRMVMLRR